MTTRAEPVDTHESGRIRNKAACSLREMADRLDTDEYASEATVTIEFFYDVHGRNAQGEAPNMRKPKMTKFAAYLPDAIYGLGDNPDAAIENACEFISTEDAEEFRNNCETAPMTDALIAAVESKGGNTDFGLLQNGTLGTYDEVEAE